MAFLNYSCVVVDTFEHCYQITYDTTKLHFDYLKWNGVWLVCDIDDLDEY